MFKIRNCNLTYFSIYDFYVSLSVKVFKGHRPRQESVTNGLPSQL